MDAPLSHIRVLDLSRILAGPWAGQMLADLGAEVIKVERPAGGDDTRQWGPPYLEDDAGKTTEESAYYLAANRGKKSITVDISSEKGQQVVHRLAEKSDVIIENYKLGGLVKYGLDYESLSATNPRLVYCSITGFGQTGPYASRPGYDFLLQAMGGLMSITGEADELPGGGPQKVGVAVTDLLTGLYAANAIQAALIERDKSGTGQYIDLALLDVQIACLANQASNYLIGGIVPLRYGNAHPNIVPYQVFKTSDDFIILAVGNDAQFRRFCEAANCAEFADNPDYVTNPERVKNRGALIPKIAARIASQTRQHWLKTLEAAGVPCGPVNNIDQVFEDPQVSARDMQISMQHPDRAELPLVANPIRLSKTPVEYKQAPPTLGQHTDSILAETLGYDEATIAALRRERAV